MKQFDSEQVRRIWQRVQAGNGLQEPQPVADTAPIWDFAQLSDAEREAGRLYLRLSRYFSGQKSRLLHQLSQQAQSRAVTLTGICRLCDCVHPAVPTPPQKRTAPQHLLRRGYTLAQQALAAYRRQAEHPQFGGVFEKMAKQQEECCRIILSLLGSLKNR